MKTIRQLSEIQQGKFYKSVDSGMICYYKANGVALWGGGPTVLSFSLGDYIGEDYVDIETPWFDHVVADLGVVEISEQEFLKAFKIFKKRKKEHLKYEKMLLKIADNQLTIF